MRSSNHIPADTSNFDQLDAPDRCDDVLTARPSAGFSLLELLVVVAILASLSTAAVLGLQTSRAPSDARVFADAFNDTRLLAISTAQVQALFVTPKGMQVVEWNYGTWRARGDIRPWQDTVTFQAPRNDGSLYIALYPSDRSDEFRLAFQSEGSVIQCVGPITGMLTCNN